MHFKTHYTLLSVRSRLWLKNYRLYSSVNACPPARMQRLASEIIQSKEFWIICCFKLRHAVTIASRSSFKLSCRTGVIWIAHESYQSIGGTVSCRDFFQQSVDPEQLTLSNQPKGYSIGFNRAFSANSRRFQKCLFKFKHSYLSQYCMKRYKTYIKM
jgi:hypothetical protein